MSIEQLPLEVLLEKARGSGLIIAAHCMLLALEEVAQTLKRLEERIAALEALKPVDGEER